MYLFQSTINCSRVKMSFSFILSGNSSELSYDFNPPIYLEDDVDYEIGLINFDSFYSIPNIDETNNAFAWTDGPYYYTIRVPTGSYEINNLIEVLQEKIKKEDDKANIKFTFNAHTSKVTITSERDIYFYLANSIGPVLGFNKMTVKAFNETEGESPIEILKVNTICVDCNIATGSFLNGQPVHIIHQFFPAVSPGYKIIETPLNTIYYPITLKRINNITLRIIDQNGDLVNFQNEVRTIRLHLRKVQ